MPMVAGQKETFDAAAVWEQVRQYLKEHHCNASWLFRKLDATHSGIVTWVDMQNHLPALISLKTPLRDAHAHALMTLVDSDRDGHVTAAELNNYLSQRPQGQRGAAGGRSSVVPDGRAEAREAARGLGYAKAEAGRATKGTGYRRAVGRSGSEKVEDPEEEEKPDISVEEMMQDIIGQEEIKAQVKTFEKTLRLDKMRQDMGKLLYKFRPPHMAFLGNPGTGKTSIARIMATVLKSLGFLRKGHLVEVQRSDLVAGAVGQTGPMTRKKIEEAKGGVLFIDEAYRLTAVDSARDFGREALDELMQGMNDGDPVMIFAGYDKDMRVFIDANPGLFRRIQKQFQFQDYTPAELAKIFLVELKKIGFTLDGTDEGEATEETLRSVIEERTLPQQRQRMNGAIVQQLIEQAKEHLDSRLDPDTMSEEEIEIQICDFQRADLEAGAGVLQENWLRFENLAKEKQPKSTQSLRQVFDAAVAKARPPTAAPGGPVAAPIVAAPAAAAPAAPSLQLAPPARRPGLAA